MNAPYKPARLRDKLQPLAPAPPLVTAPSPAGVASGEPGTPIRDTPEWSISPSKFDWQIMIFGGENPRTGFPQPPLEFQFFGPHFTRRQIEERAADLAEREFRTSYIIREPTDRKFMRSQLRKVA